jgi:hypothetical protein
MLPPVRSLKVEIFTYHGKCLAGFKFFDLNNVCFFEVGITSRNFNKTTVAIEADSKIIGAKYLLNQIEGDAFITDFQLMMIK